MDHGLLMNPATTFGITREFPASTSRGIVQYLRAFVKCLGELLVPPSI
jgi:hypothetical protein